MESIVGYKLGFNDHVHHKDNDGLNNAESNLELMSRSKHSAHHNFGSHFGRVDGEHNGRYRHDLLDEAFEVLRTSGLSFAEIAKKLGCSKYTAMKRLGWSRPENHLVKSVEVINSREDVFCGTVEGFGKFFISLDDRSGVLVSNCGEQPLNKYGNCCLGSINLSQLVRRPFSPDAYFDFTEFSTMVEKGMIFLDVVIDYAYEKHPLQAQALASKETRRTGLGVTALGDMFFKLGLEYGGLPSMKLTREIFKTMRDVAYKTSIERARAFGAFEKFNPTYHLAMGFIQRLPHDIQSGILNHGIRNACLLTIPPVGTGSVLAGCSSGIEPIFAASYTRRSETLSEEFYDVDHDIVVEYKSVRNDWPPPYFKTAHDIDPLVRVQMQALIQEYIDSSISSTVNLSKDTPVDAVERIYLEAWRRGCKGITVYREGSREGILITKDSVTVEKSYRALDLAGRTFKTRTGYGNLYITVNTDINDNPLEVFIHIGKSGFSTTADAEALGRMISLALRRHTPVDEIVRQLEDIGSDRPVFSNGGLVKSVPDAVAQVLEKYIKDKEVKERPQSAPFANVPDFCRRPMECQARYENGCLVCFLCGESKC
jgi:ribonucleoside-diphosphate reductase alpha chain